MPNLKEHLASVKYRREHLKAEIDKELLRIKTKISEFEALLDDSGLEKRPEVSISWNTPFVGVGWIKATLFYDFILDFLKKEQSCYHFEECLKQLKKVDNDLIEQFYVSQIS